jgi:hypothetical protein
MDTTTDAQPVVDGEWVFPSVSYVEPRRIACALCGRPIARKYWRVSIKDQQLVFCEPAHAGLYESYWIPTHGNDQNPGRSHARGECRTNRPDSAMIH